MTERSNCTCTLCNAGRIFFQGYDAYGCGEEVWKCEGKEGSCGSFFRGVRRRRGIELSPIADATRVLVSEEVPIAQVS